MPKHTNKIDKIAKIKEFIKEHLPHLQFDETTFVGISRKARFIDSVYGEWWVLPSSILSGNTKGHPKGKAVRMMDAKRKETGYGSFAESPKGKKRLSELFTMPFEVAETRVKALNPKVTIIKESYKSVSKKCQLFHEEFGLFEKNLAGCFYNNYLGHPKERKVAKLPYEEVLARIQLINPKVSIIKETYKSTAKKCQMVEEGVGEFSAKASDFLYGTLTGHPINMKAKTKETNRKRYGSDFYNSSDTGRAAVKARIAAEGHHMHNPEIVARIQATNLVKYGYKNPLQNEEVKAKIVQTNLKKYGATSPQKNAEVQAKTAATNMQRYGGKSTMHSEEVYLKNLRSSRETTKLKHWSTGREVLCRGSYEVVVVNYLNANKIPYKWQIKFKLPSGAVYICDLYLPNDDKYVEIKGYFRGDAEAKWNEFQTLYANSELWNKQRLIDMGLIGKSHPYVLKKLPK